MKPLRTLGCVLLAWSVPVSIIVTMSVSRILPHAVGRMALIDKTPTTSSDTATSLKSNSSGQNKPVCTNSLFREYYRRENTFPPPRDPGIAQPARRAAFPVLTPSICSFPQRIIERSFLRTCLKTKQTRSVLLLGDSQGVRYSWGLLTMLQRVFHRCDYLKREVTSQQTPVDRDYFADGNSTLAAKMEVTQRLCSLCVSYKVLCCGRSLRDLTFEYIGMHHMSEYGMTVDMGDENDTERKPTSFQEFIFRYYVTESPDVIIVSPPVNHVKFTSLPNNFRLQFKSFKSLIDTWIPETAQVYWLPGTAEVESRKSAEYVNRTWHGKLANEHILDINRVIYEELASDLEHDNRRHYGFLDLFQASQDRGEWSKDGVHFQTFWYELMMSYVLQLFCMQS